MNKDTENALKVMVKSGGVSILESLKSEILRDMKPPKFTTGAEKLVYDTALFEGIEKGMEILIEELNQHGSI